MKLLHTADLHLGKVLHEQSLLEDQAHILNRIVAELERDDYDAFVVAGDIFDRSVPPPEAVVLWDDFLVRVRAARPALPVLVIAGNHDGAVRLSWSARFLAERGIHVATQAERLTERVTVNTAEGQWDFYLVPFLQAGTLDAAGGDDPVLRSQRDLWQQALERLSAARRPGVPSVLVAHLFTVGGTESDSERVFLGEAEQVPASWLAGWDYVALGHLHQPQEPAPGVRYSGSPLAYSFSEAGQAKSLVRWVDGVVEFLPLAPLHPLSRIVGTYESLCQEKKWDAYHDHWLEVTLTDPALVSSPLERLRPRFPRLLSLRQSPAPAASEPAVADNRQTGDLANDAVNFLKALGHDAAALRPRLTAVAQEVLRETP